MIDLNQKQLRSRILQDAEGAILKGDGQRLASLAQEAKDLHQLELAYYLLARKAFIENNLTEALSKLEDSLGIDPVFIQSLALKLVVLIQDENYEGAIQAANLAIPLAPFTNDQYAAQLYLNKGVAYARSGKPAETIFCYLKALELNDVYVTAYRNLLSILVSNKEWIDVILVTQKIGEKLYDEPRFLGETASMLLAEGREALESDKTDLDAMLTKEARNLTEIALRVSPENPEHLYNLACCSSHEGKKEEALKYLRDALNKNPELKAQALADPDFAKIKDDPEFISLVSQVESAN